MRTIIASLSVTPAGRPCERQCRLVDDRAGAGFARLGSDHGGGFRARDACRQLIFERASRSDIDTPAGQKAL
jgi:hypothetical protein